MATTAETEHDDPKQKRQAPQRGGRRWWPWLVACMLIVCAAPTLICLPALRDRALSAGVTAAAVKGQAQVGSLSIGWLSPLAVTDFKLSDLNGRPLATLPEIANDRSLLDLLLDRSDVGHLRLVHPVISLELRDDGSNLEDVFADVLARAHRPPTFACDVEIVDGTVLLTDVAANRTWKLEQVNLRLIRPRQGDGEISCTAAMPDTGADSHFKLQGRLPAAASAAETGNGAQPATVALDATGFPLEALRAVLARVAPRAAIAGRFDGQLEYTGSAPGEGSLSGNAAISDLRLAGPALGEDVVRLSRIELPCQLAIKGSEVTIQKLALQSDVGQMSGAGSAKLSTEPATPLLQSAQGDISGQIDLVRVARLLPHRIRMRPGADLAAPVQFHIAPHLRRENGLILELEAGRVLDHVQASPELCDAWLKFALPVLAEVTQVAGEFSVDVQGLRMPLANLATSQTAGTILIHELELGPGPLVQQFLPAIEAMRGLSGTNESSSMERLSLARDSKVEFRLVDGRVYHEGLRLQFPRFAIETHGSVGFDESLAMMAEIMFTGNTFSGPLARAIKSRPIQLPIGGTLRKPKVDLAQIRAMGGQRLRDTARELIGNELERGLDRLLRPKD